MDLGCKAIADGAFQCFFIPVMIFCGLSALLFAATESKMKIAGLVGSVGTLVAVAILFFKEMIRCGAW